MGCLLRGCHLHMLQAATTSKEHTTTLKGSKGSTESPVEETNKKRWVEDSDKSDIGRKSQMAYFHDITPSAPTYRGVRYNYYNHISNCSTPKRRADGKRCSVLSANSAIFPEDLRMQKCSLLTGSSDNVGAA